MRCKMGRCYLQYNLPFPILRMIPLSEVSVPSVLIATVASMLVGFLWYSPKVFGGKWADIVDIDMDMEDKDMKHEMMTAMAQGFVSTLVSAFCVAVLLAALAPQSLAEGLMVGFVMWLGLVSYTVLGRVIWEKQPIALYGINAGHGLLIIEVMVAVLVLVQV